MPRADSIPHTLSAYVLIISFVIGCIGTFRRELFLKIPNYGYIPWALFGGSIPPYFDASVTWKENFENFTQDGDILIVSGPKSGTVYLNNIVWLLRSGGEDPKPHEESPELSLFGTIGILLYPKHTFKMRLDEEKKRRRMQQDRGMISFQFSTHNFPRYNSKEVGLRPDLYPKLRYIVIVRNGKEVTRSFYDFMNSHTPELRKMWGGFPPPMKTPQDMLTFITKDLPDFYFHFVSAWYNVKNLPNVLLLHYSNLRKDPRTSVREIAKFLNIPLDDELLQIILKKSSIEYMSDRHDLYFTKAGEPGGERFKFVEEGKHIRANGGRIDQGGTFFTPVMDRIWNEAVEKYFGHNDKALTQFADHGRP
jgi:hypothetical protein